MAERGIASIINLPDGLIFEWEALTQDGGSPDTAVELDLSEFANPIIEVEDAGTGTGTITFTGGFKSETPHPTLKDPQGNDLAFTANAIAVVSTTPSYITPVLSGQDGTTNRTPRVLVRHEN